MRQTIKELTITISPEKLRKMRELVPDVFKERSDKEVIDHLNISCKNGEAYYSFKGWFRVYLPAVGIWLFLGSGKTPCVDGKYRREAKDIEKNTPLKNLPAITLEFELQMQKSQDTAPKVRALIFTKKMLDHLRKEITSLQKMDDAAIIDYLNKNANNISYRKAVGSTKVFIENLKVHLKIGSGRRVVEIKRDIDARGNKWAEVRYELDKK